VCEVDHGVWFLVSFQWVAWCRQGFAVLAAGSTPAPLPNKIKRLHMESVYLVVIVHENGSLWVHSVHGTMEGAEVMMEKCRAENGKDDYGLHFDFCHIVKRPFYL